VMGSALATGLSRTLAAASCSASSCTATTGSGCCAAGWRWDGPWLRDPARRPAGGHGHAGLRVVGRLPAQVVGLSGRMRTAPTAWGSAVESLADDPDGHRRPRPPVAHAVARATSRGPAAAWAGGGRRLHDRHRPASSCSPADAGLHLHSDAGILGSASYIGVMAFARVPQAPRRWLRRHGGRRRHAAHVLISIPGRPARAAGAWFAVELHGGLRGVWYAILVSALLGPPA
jgi:hypothetical protein